MLNPKELFRSGFFMTINKILKYRNHFKFISMMTCPLLVAFDFDHTIADDNTDIVVRKLIPEEKLPDSVKGLYRSDGWTAYMGKIFELLHANNIRDAEIRTAVNNVPSVTGIESLMEQLHSLGCEIIIISDANSVFINQWLSNRNLNHTVAEVFTNPAWYDDKGMLRIEMHHLQDWCKLSTKNLCKGHILDSYMKKRREEGITFDRVAYIGDGKNDLCPILRLSENDLAFPRIDYALKKLLDTDSDTEKQVKAEIIPWDNGSDILKELIKALSTAETAV